VRNPRRRARGLRRGRRRRGRRRPPGRRRVRGGRGVGRGFRGRVRRGNVRRGGRGPRRRGGGRREVGESSPDANPEKELPRLPVPYGVPTSYQGGTRSGPRAILEASRNMELWDEELGATYRAGIHTLPGLEPTALGPEAMVDRVEQAVGWILDRGKLPVMLGGEHSITAGAVRAAARRFKRLSVLQLDAHADLRDRYLDSPYSHACVMRRVRERVPVASVGRRSMSEEEAPVLRREPAPT